LILLGDGSAEAAIGIPITKDWRGFTGGADRARFFLACVVERFFCAGVAGFGAWADMGIPISQYRHWLCKQSGWKASGGAGLMGGGYFWNMQA